MNQILSPFFLFFVFLGNAQQLEDNSTVYHVRENGISITFSVLDREEKGVKSYSEDKFYYWSKAQKVIATQGGSSGQLLHGTYESCYSNKQLKEKGTFYKGQKDGVWSLWNEKGFLLRKENWRKGILHGKQFTYDQSGNLTKVTTICGKPIAQNHDTLVHLGKNSQSIQYYDSLGNLQSVERYKNGLLDGKQEIIFTDGTKTVATYDKGVLIEPSKKTKEEKPTQEETEVNPSKRNLFQRLAFWKKKNKEETDSSKVSEANKEKRNSDTPKKRIFKKKQAE
jgi:antitoxin component YwqK of YwqJK toxin-antitoxin module